MNRDFDWQEFFRFSQKIFSELANTTDVSEEQESLCRIAISRAYYAAFNIAKGFLLESNPYFMNGCEGSHQAVINAFLHDGNKYRRRIGTKLSYFKEMRVRADYNSQRYPRRGMSGNAVVELKSALYMAEEIFDIIERCKM